MSAPAAVIRTGPRRGTVLGIVAAVAALVILATVAWALTRGPERRNDYLSGSSGTDSGTRALLEVLRDRGVDVREVDSFAALDALDLDAASTTVALYDAALVLGESRHADLLAAAHRVVVFDAWDVEVADLAPGVELDLETFSAGTAEAECSLPAAQRAEEIVVSGVVYDISGTDAEGCFPVDDSFAVVRTETDGTEVVLVGASEAFTNGGILGAGNAAFALNLLGQDPTLVWYTPDLDDLEPGTVLSPADVSPPWVTPLVVLLGVVVLVAAVWQGRRFGPLVRERLPVIVRSSETLEGRARLYERAGARGHALDSLRAGTRRRLVGHLGLGRRASDDEVVAAVAALTGRDRDAVATLLADGEPGSDRALVALSDSLLRLETEVADLARAR